MPSAAHPHRFLCVAGWPRGRRDPPRWPPPGLLTVGLLAVLACVPPSVAAEPAQLVDEAWLELLHDGARLGWARERLFSGPGAALRVERRAAVGDRREQLEAAAAAVGALEGVKHVRRV